MGRETCTASPRFVCGYLRRNPPCCCDNDGKEAGSVHSRGGKGSLFLEKMSCLLLDLNAIFEQRCTILDAKTEGIGGEDKKRLDKDDDEKSTWENIV